MPGPGSGVSPRTTYALITGGGTGGHVYPGLALAEALVARGHARESIHWVGSEGKLEETAVPGAGFTIDVLPGRGLQRRLTLENAEVVLKTARALGLTIPQDVLMQATEVIQ